jgi:DNA-binding transcriptional ArsR family regulator
MVTTIKPFFQINSVTTIEVPSQMYDNDPELRRLLWFLLGGKRGGENRARIIQSVRIRPRNLNQLANELGLQYKAVQHHVKILLNSSLLVTSGEGYGTLYMLSPWFKHHIEIFDEVCAKIGIRNLLKNSH